MSKAKISIGLDGKTVNDYFYYGILIIRVTQKYLSHEPSVVDVDLWLYTNIKENIILMTALATAENKSSISIALLDSSRRWPILFYIRASRRIGKLLNVGQGKSGACNHL